MAILDNKELSMKVIEDVGYYDYEYVSLGYQLKNGLQVL